MKNPFQFITFAVAFSITVGTAHGGLLDQLKSVVTTTNSPAAAVAALSQDQVVAGLKAALSKGVSNAVVTLGHSGGFLTNAAVKIPLPGKLAAVESALRLAGQGELTDNFIASMNHAAEQAVPLAAGVFGDSISQMSIADAKGILSGTNDAATQYFKRTTQTNLFAKFYPVVQKATDSVGVTAEYKTMMAKFSSVNTLSSMFGKSSPVALNAIDIDTYVTHKALDGLFKMVAVEEKKHPRQPPRALDGLVEDSVRFCHQINPSPSWGRGAHPFTALNIARHFARCSSCSTMRGGYLDFDRSSGFSHGC
jgi:hypothetical protein